MDAKNTLQQIIREEFHAVLNEIKEKQKRPSIGKKKSKKGGARFTSAGTIKPVKGRKLSDSQIKNREEIGKKMLNMFRRGGEKGKAFREKINAQLKNRKDSEGKQFSLPTDRKHQYSQIWANASGMAAKNATAADFPRKPKSKKKSQTD